VASGLQFDLLLGASSEENLNASVLTAGRTGPLQWDLKHMKTTVFLRIAAVLTLIHSILHTIGGVFGKPLPGAAEQAVAAMKANRFQLMGNPRSYWDFYMGLGLGITISLTADAIVFWLLASLARTESARLRPVLLVFALAYLGIAIDSYRFFFIGPVIGGVLIVICLVGAILTAKEPSPSWETRSRETR